MTDEDVVRRFAAIIAIGKVTKPRKRPNRKQQWQWRAFGLEAMRHLDATIGPHLGERRRHRLDEALTYKPRRAAERGRWLAPREFADASIVSITESEIRTLLLLGRAPNWINGLSGVGWYRISRVRDSLHPAALKRAREIYQPPKKTKPPCELAWCEREQKARGLCAMHYWRSRNGVPLDRPFGRW